MTSYIYKITNSKTNKSYVGKHTWKGEGVDSKYWGSGLLIRKEIQKYGLDSFSREILEYVNDSDSIFDREAFWIKKLNTLVPNGYNLTVESLGGFYSIDENTNELVYRGRSNWEDLSEEEKRVKLQKMHSAARTPEARQRISEGNRRKYASWNSEKWQSFKKNCSDGWSQETRLAQKEKVKGEKNGMYGKSYYERWIELYGKEKADELMKDHSRKISEKSKSTNHDPIVRARYNRTIELKRSCEHYKAWQKARADQQGLKVRFKRGKVNQTEFDRLFPILKQKEEDLASLLKEEMKEIER